MNITEEDVRSELGKNGLAAWNCIVGTNVLWLCPTNDRPHISIAMDTGCVSISGDVGEVSFDDVSVELVELDSGAINYGFLSSWNVHVLPALRSIVRLITGEKQPEKIEIVEASVEDKMLAILADHEIEQSDEEIEKTRISEDGFARIYASEMVVVIQPEEEVMHISTLNPAETFTHDFCEWDNFDAETFPHGSIGYVWWLDHLRHALFEIIELLESPESTPEKTLEKKVLEYLAGQAVNVAVNVDEVNRTVELQHNSDVYLIDSDQITLHGENEPRILLSVEDYKKNHKRVIDYVMCDIAAILAESTPEKSLEEKVRGWIDDETKIGLRSVEVIDGEVLIHFKSRTDRIAGDLIYEGRTGDVWHKTTLRVSRFSENYQSAIHNIMNELKTHLPSPTYTELEQRVRELEERLSTSANTVTTIQADLERTEKERDEAYAKLAELRENYNQLASVDGQKTERITELEAQLQSSVSEADHEAEVQKWVAYCDSETKEHQKTRSKLIRYREWWESEYAKNAEASQ